MKGSRRNGINARVHNAGVSGDTTAAGKTRLAFVLDNLDRKPDLVVLGLGGNDMLRGIKPAETKANMIAMLDELKRREIPVMLTGMLAAPNLGQDYGNAFNAIFPQLAKQYDAPLYPFFLEGADAAR
jgi:acyl-CoA thioesterase I